MKTIRYGVMGAGLMSTVAVAAGLLVYADFEHRWKLTPFSASPGTPGIVAPSTTVARSGVRSVKTELTLAQWQDTNEGRRAELVQPTQTRTEFVLGQLSWVGFAQFRPSWWVADDPGNPELIWQFHGWSGGPGSGSPPLALYLRGENYSLEVRYATTAADGSPSSKSVAVWVSPLNVDNGRWVDWVIAVTFAVVNGRVQVWKNGVRIVDYTGSTIYHMPTETNQRGPYVRFGVYKWRWGTRPTLVGSRTVYTDEIRIGNAQATCADVKPRAAAMCQ